jgi:hypothetical protein
MAVNRVAMHREPIGEEELVYLVAGLGGAAARLRA